MGVENNRGIVGLVVVSNQLRLQHVVAGLADLEARRSTHRDGHSRRDPAAILLVLFKRGVEAFGKIAAAFWTMALTCFGIAGFVLVAGAFSRGVQWVVATVPDNFWQKLITGAS